MKNAVFLTATTIAAAILAAFAIACTSEPAVTEKIVEVEVTRQVTVETVIEKEVVKEVPVEKVVVQQIVEKVPVEVVVEREVVKEIPVEKLVVKEVVETVLVEVVIEKEVVTEKPVVTVTIQQVIVTATPTTTPTQTQTLIPTSTLTPTATPASISTPVPSGTQNPIPTPTSTPTPIPTSTRTPIPTPTPTPTPSAPSASDREVLVALFNSTDGPNWENSENWLSDRPISEWHGVTASSDGRVVKLDLSENNMTGEIPIILGQLSKMRELVLGENELTGTIPPVLGQLLHMERIRLGNNRLVGAIPSEFGQLSKLRSLELDGNSLEAVPTEIGKLSNLVWLDISDNNIGALPAEIGQLASLESLLLYRNNLKVIPPGIWQLSNLRELNIEGNAELTGVLPETATNIPYMHRFRFEDTGLCAPLDDKFQTWLLSISDRRGPDCAGTPSANGSTDHGLIVRDIFGRIVNDTGIVVVDWEGQIANPMMKYSVELPFGSASLSSNEPRLYFDLPSSVGGRGPSKNLKSQGPGQPAEFRISIFPDRDTVDENHILTVRHLNAQGQVRTQSIDIHVIDQDLDRPLEFHIFANFSHDRTGFFDDQSARAAVQQGADDFAYFVADMELDEVPINGEGNMWINEPGDANRVVRWGEGENVRNSFAYTGFWLTVYGKYQKEGGAGGGGGTSSLRNQTSGGKEYPIRRSGNITINPRGNWGSDGWSTSFDDNRWWAAWDHGKADLYSIALHETGHAVLFHSGHDGFAAFYEPREVIDPIVEAYYGSYPSMDYSGHLRDSTDPASRMGAFGAHKFLEIPTGRELLTKLDILVAQASGYVLRDTSPFRDLSISTDALPEAKPGEEYTHTIEAIGGIPAYHWTIDSGELPDGLSLDSFTGAISGTPTESGTFNFTLRLRDQTEGHPGVTRDVTLTVSN